MEYKKTTLEIDECVTELTRLYEEQKKEHPDTLNMNIVKLKPEVKLMLDLGVTCDYCYKVLREVVKKYRIAPIEETEFIKSDVKRLCVLLFKPYFNKCDWIKNTCMKYAKISSDYKYEHGIVDEEAPDGLYNSVIVYLKDFVINLTI